jgi:transglutaminase-like putative cysteine protease
MVTSPDIELTKIPTGYAGTQATVRRVIDLITSGAKDFHVRQTAIAILRRREVRPKDYLGEIKALFEWVQRHVRYTRDPSRVEVLHSARRMLELRAGDCDDMSIVLGAMLEAIGHAVRIVITGSNAARPDVFTHIYIEVLHRGRWLALDATMPYPMGWAPRTPVKQVIPLSKARAGDGASIREGVGLYRAFNRFGPARLARVRHRRVMPPVVVELGRLTGLIYRCDKWRRGHPRTFIHFMTDAPRLVSNAAGTQLYLVGGRYRVTPRGIEG